MNRVILVFLVGLLVNVFAFAQVNLIGRATQEMDTAGFSAAPSNPMISLGSMVTIINTDTGEEMNVSVSGRISASPNRIVDLSREVWEKLNIGPDTLVRVISPARQAQPVTSAEPEPEPAPVRAPPPPPPPPAPAPTSASVFYPDDEDDDGGFDALAWEDDDDLVEFEEVAEVADIIDDTEIIEAVVAVAPPPARRVEERAPVAPPPPPPVPVAPPSSSSSSLPTFSQSLYHLLILDRTHCTANADIGTQHNMQVLYNFKDGKNGYLVALYTSAHETPALPVGARVLANLATENKSAIREYVNSGAFKRFVANPQVLSRLQELLAEGATGANILGNIKIIPSLPNPNSGKTYRLQVGAFSVPDSAARTMQQLRAVGLTAAQEQYGSLLRVSAVGVRAADVYAAVQKLEAAGFKEVWIRE